VTEDRRGLGAELAVLRAGDRVTAERIDDRCALGGEQQQLALVHFHRLDVRSRRELRTPRPLRLRPRPEARLPERVRRLVRRREQARQRGVLRLGKQPPVAQEGLGVVERPEGAVLREAALLRATRAQLGQRRLSH
jgi:hypothetical protein